MTGVYCVSLNKILILKCYISLPGFRDIWSILKATLHATKPEILCVKNLSLRLHSHSPWRHFTVSGNYIYQLTALQSYQCCWSICFPVSSILAAAQGGGGPAPGSHPDAHTLAREYDTHPAAAPRRGHQPDPRCSPVRKVIYRVQLSVAEENRSRGGWRHSF